MRQVFHSAIGFAFWALMAVLWVLLVVEHKARAESIAYSVEYLGTVTGAVLAVTLWWIRHNTRIYRRKGPRTGRPALPPRVDEDRLQRPIRWQLEGGAEHAVDAGHLVIHLDGSAKVYTRAG